jgi:hypothetical protein
VSLSYSSRALVATATVALLAGCSGGSGTSPLGAISQTGSQSINHKQTTQSLSHSELLAKTLLVKPGVKALLQHGTPKVVKNTRLFTGKAMFVSDAGSNEVYRIGAGGKVAVVGSGWSEPQGMGTDQSGNVYVADTANSRIVELSPAGAPVAILSDPGQYPAGVAIAPDGTVGVTNIISTSGGEGSVSFYAAGSTSPECTSSGVLSEDYFIGVDASVNFYFDGFNASTGEVTLATTTPCGTVSDTGLSGPSEFPGGVAVTAAKVKVGKTKQVEETLNWGDQSALEVFTYALPSYSAGSTIALSGGSDEVEISIAKKETLIGSADAGLAQAEAWDYPAGGSSPVLTVTGFAEPIGISFTAAPLE